MIWPLSLSHIISFLFFFLSPGAFPLACKSKQKKAFIDPMFPSSYLLSFQLLFIGKCSKELYFILESTSFPPILSWTNLNKALSLPPYRTAPFSVTNELHVAESRDQLSALSDVNMVDYSLFFETPSLLSHWGHSLNPFLPHSVTFAGSSELCDGRPCAQPLDLFICIDTHSQDDLIQVHDFKCHV